MTSNFQNPLENGGNSRTKSVETLESDVFHDPKATVLDLFRPTLMLFRSTNMFYQWFSVTMCYYGLSFASVNLLGDPYTNAALSYFIEIPGKYQSTISCYYLQKFQIFMLAVRLHSSGASKDRDFWSSCI